MPSGGASFETSEEAWCKVAYHWEVCLHSHRMHPYAAPRVAADEQHLGRHSAQISHAGGGPCAVGAVSPQFNATYSLRPWSFRRPGRPQAMAIAFQLPIHYLFACRQQRFPNSLTPCTLSSRLTDASRPALRALREPHCKLTAGSCRRPGPPRPAPQSLRAAPHEGGGAAGAGHRGDGEGDRGREDRRRGGPVL